MKKFAIILVCMSVCLSLFSGCRASKENEKPESDFGNSVDVDIDVDAKGDTEISSGDSGIVFDFKDPENPDGIVISPKE